MVLLNGVGIGRLIAQTPPSPYIEWQHRHAPLLKHAGHRMDWDSGSDIHAPTYTLTENGWNGTEAQNVDGSGRDWWHAITLVRDASGTVIGYCAVGYSTFTNWKRSNGCATDNLWNPAIPEPWNLEYYDRRNKGGVLGAVAMYDLNGGIEWYKTIGIGIFFDVVQKVNGGDLVITGTAANRIPLVGDPVHPSPIALNPTPGFAGHIAAQQQECDPHSRRTAAIKMTNSGDILWNHQYLPLNPGDAGFDAMMQSQKGEGWSIAPTSITGTAGYRVVGTQVYDSNDSFRPYVIDIDENGKLLNNNLYEQLPVAGNNQTILGGRLFAIASHGAGLDEVLAITGYTVTSDPTASGTFLWIMNSQGTLSFQRVDQAANGLDPSRAENSNHLAFATAGNEVSVIWPVMADFTLDGVLPGGIDAGNHQARGLVFRVRPDGTHVWEQPVDLGLLRAFDLQLAAVQTSDGDIAVTGTKWSPGKSFDQPDSPQLYNNIAPTTRAFLESPQGLGYDLFFGDLGGGAQWHPYGWNILDDDPPTFGYGLHTGNYSYGYWYTDSYLAKLNPDGTIAWDAQWDSYEGSSELVFPGNFRQRQCNFDIVEAPDGGLVLVGNTGHNFDDAYIAKLRPCDEVEYVNGPALDPNGEHHVAASATWNTDMKVEGSIVIDAGVTLTIDGATLSFDESTPTLTTNIVVQPGGGLRLINGAELTSTQTCERHMWDGVKNLGNGTTVGAGIVVLEDGTKVSNAWTAVLCGEDDPKNPDQLNTVGTGGIVHATQASFVNNRRDVFMTEHTGFDPLEAGTSYFDHCTFSTTRQLNDPSAIPLGHLSFANSHNVALTACKFTNNSGVNVSTPLDWGTAILGYNTTVTVDADAGTGERTLVDGMYFGLTHMSFDPSKTYRFDQVDFIDNGVAMHTAATHNQRITRCTFDVPDHASPAGAAIGTTLYGASGYEFEENTFVGHGNETSQPEVGSVFLQSGPEANLIYNNRYDGFNGSGASGYSAGTIIMGENAGPGGANGTQIKCNDFSDTAPNYYEIAFTGSQTYPLVSIGGQQGTLPTNTDDVEAPAGNTFSFADCLIEEGRNIFVGLEANLSVFEYWHHTPQIGVVQLVPECASAPVDPLSWYTDAQVFYVKPTACPTQLSADGLVDDHLAEAEEADEELAVLQEVYDDWSDGGDTEGLIQFIQDPSNGSYIVRNELMLVAPRVSVEAWREVFLRSPAMNPWHLAQALIANSPLQPEVIQMMEESDMEPFHKELVLDGQNGGASMHSIYQSEIAFLYGNKSRALHDAAARVLLGLEPGKVDDVLAALDAIKIAHAAERILALLHAKNDLSTARTLVDARLLADPGNGYWIVQDLFLIQREQSASVSAIGTAELVELRSIAAQRMEGAPEACAWLTMLGEPCAEELVLPDLAKRARIEPRTRQGSSSDLLSAYPNPSNGPVYLVYKVPDGVEQVELRLMDAAGKLVLQQNVAARNGILEVLPAQLSAGMHIASLHCDGMEIASSKVNVVR